MYIIIKFMFLDLLMLMEINTIHHTSVNLVDNSC
jgi:hypothetical protein